MKRIITISKVAVLALAVMPVLSSCKRAVADSDAQDREITFTTAVNNMKSSLDGSATVADTCGRTFFLRSADGSVEIPVTVTVSDGMPASSQTRGRLINGPLDPGVEGDDQPIALADSLGEFTVHAYNADDHTPIFQSADSVAVWNGSRWKLGHAYYWPGATVLDFYAYANLPASKYAIVKADVAAGTQTLTYTVPSDTDDQTDILMAISKGTGNVRGEAEIMFHHPLAAVQFSTDAETIEGITEVTISGVHYRGTVVQNMDDPSIFNWTTSDKDTEVSQDNDGRPFEVHGDIHGDPFLLIPQTVTAVKYIELTVTAVYNGHEIPLNAVVDNTRWEAGKTYTYNIGFTGTLETELFQTRQSETLIKDVYVQNTGTRDCYVRVALVGYMVNSMGEIGSTWLDDSGVNKGTFTVSSGTFGSAIWNNGWVKGTDGFYYYRKPLHFSSSDKTTNLFDSYTISGVSVGSHFSMDISAQSVEYDSGKDYVTRTWGAEAAALLE